MKDLKNPRTKKFFQKSICKTNMTVQQLVVQIELRVDGNCIGYYE